MINRPKTTLSGLLLVALFSSCASPSTSSAYSEPERAVLEKTEEISDNATKDKTAATDPLTPSESCTNEAVGYTVSYPANWLTNSGEVVEHCQVFDPESPQVPERSESFDKAVFIDLEKVPFSRVAREDPDTWELSRKTTTVDGRQAVVIESESTGAALLPKGIRSYKYLVELDGKTLVAVTYDVKGQNYQTNKRVLDKMMDSMKFTHSATNL